jgi:hypothetical protein
MASPAAAHVIGSDAEAVDAHIASTDTWIENAKNLALGVPESQRAAIYAEIAKTRAIQALAAAVQALAERGEA